MRKTKSVFQWFGEHPGALLYIVVTLPMVAIIAAIGQKENLKSIGAIIVLTAWAIVSLLMIGYYIWEYANYRYWVNFHKKYGKEYIKISVPLKYWCDFESHFLLYDEKEQVKMGAKTKEEAIAKHKETGLYITRVIDKL